MAVLNWAECAQEYLKKMRIFQLFFPSWMGRKILPSSPHFHSRAGIQLERIKKKKKMGIGKKGDPGQGCLSKIPGNPSLLPAFLGWNWADLEQEMPLDGSMRS